MGSGTDRESGRARQLSIIRRYVRVIRADLARIVSVALAGSACLLLLMLLRAPTYLSAAVLEIERDDDADNSTAAAGLTVQTASGVVNSRAVLDAALSSLALAAHPDFHQADVLQRFENDLQVGGVPGTRLLRIAFSSPDPEFSRASVEAIVSAYLTYNDTLQLNRLQHSAQLLLRKLDVLLDNPALQPELGEDLGNVDRAAVSLPRASSLEALKLPADLAEGWQLRSMVRPLPQNAQALLYPDQQIQQFLEEAMVRSVVETHESSARRGIQVTVVDPATLPTHAESRWSAGPLLLLFALLSLAGVALPVLRHRRRATVLTAAEAGSALGLPVLVSLPDTAQSQEARGEEQAPGGDPHYSEAVRKLRTLLEAHKPQIDEGGSEMFSGYNPRGRIVLVTSACPGDGKTSLALNLALSLGQVQRVLLVNGDLRSNIGFCQLPQGSAGLSHLIAGAAQLRDCIHRLPEEGIDLMPAGVLPPNPQELLASKRFRRVLEALAHRYDYIVLDSLALQTACDTLLLSQHCSDLLFIMQAGQTPLGQAQEALQQLAAVPGPRPQLLLNRLGSAVPRRFGQERPSASPAAAYVYRKPGGNYLASH